MNPVLANAALSQLQAGRDDIAGAMAGQLIRADPEDFFAWAIQGAVMQRQGKRFQALEAWARAIGCADRRGDVVPAARIVTLLQVNAGRPKDALRLWHSVLEQQPAPDVHAAYAEFLESVGRPADSVRRLVEAMTGGAAPPAPRRPRWVGERVLCLVAGSVRGRETRIAAAARAQGWRVLLISGSADPDLGAIDRYVDERHYFDDAQQALELCRRIRPTLFHICTGLAHLVPATIIADGLGPVVIDFYDHLNFSVAQGNPYPAVEGELERYCMTRADALCARSLAPQLLRRAWSLRQPVLFWPEYALADPVEPRPKRRLQDGELHMVCGGSVFPNPLGDRGAGNPEDLLPLIRRMTGHGVHFHLFPINLGDDNRPMWADYRECAEQNPRFHLERPLAGDDWRAELTSHDIGWFDAPSRFRGLPSTMIERKAIDLSFANKVTDFIEAGVQVMVHPGRLAGWIAARLGVAIECSFDDFDRPAFWDEVRARVEAGADFAGARARWSLEAHAPRLDRFYRRVAEARLTPTPAGMEMAAD